MTPFSQADDRACLERYVHDLVIDSTPDGDLISAFVACLRDARQDTGRDPSSGLLLPPGEADRVPGHWPGSLCYLALLDQIGSCIRPVHRRLPSWKHSNGQVKKINDFQRALLLFGGRLQRQQVEALWALRCSWAHDFGLLTATTHRVKTPQGPGRKATTRLYRGWTHLFRVVDCPPGQGCDYIVDVPAVPGGRAFTHRAKDRTTVNLRFLQEHIEGVVRDVQSHARTGTLKLTITRAEFESRYTWMRGHT